MPRKVISAFVVLTFLAAAVPVPGRAGEIFLPVPGAGLTTSPAFIPPMILGITVDAKDPLKFNFLIDQGDVGAGHARPVQDDALKEEYRKLIKYFLASLTIPEKDLWVNLSPYEGQRIIPPAFGRTEMGRDLLGQDYVLKQVTASLIYPESELGKKFWADVYKKAHEQYGTTDIPVNTFNKVWIVPDEAMVYEHDGTALVVKSHLKVLLEEDYLALSKNIVGAGHAQPVQGVNRLGSQVVREIVLPALEKEVNEGRNFALLRQINNALVLATWYKRALKESLLSRFYVDKSKTSGLEYATPNNDIEHIYRQYLQAFKKGVYNYIKEETDPYTRQTVPRKYLSGGFQGDYARVVQVTTDRTRVPLDLVRRIASGAANHRIVDVAMKAEELKDSAQTADASERQVLSDQDAQLLKNFIPSLREALMSRWERILELRGRQQLTSAETSEIVRLINEISYQIQQSVKPYQFDEIGVVLDKIMPILKEKKYVSEGYRVNLQFDGLDQGTRDTLEAKGYTQGQIQGIEKILRQTKETVEKTSIPSNYLLTTLKKGYTKTKGGREIGVDFDVINKICGPIQGYLGLLNFDPKGSEGYSEMMENLWRVVDQSDTMMTKVMGFFSYIERDPHIYWVTLDDETRIIDWTVWTAPPKDVDSAQTAVVARTPGGIDLNPANLNLRIKRDGSTSLTTGGKGVPLPIGRQDMSDLERIEGLVPVIIKIVPATHIPALSELLSTVN